MFVDNYLQVPGAAPYGGGMTELVGGGMGGRRFDPGMLRPYFDRNGRPAVTINTGRTTLVRGEQRPLREHRLIRDLVNNGIMSPVFNATSLRKEEWLELDRVVLRAARYRLRAWSDLAAANSFGGFNGMSKLLLEHETMSDPGVAVVDMDGLTEGRTDAPKFQLEGLPLPITHSDFWFSSRRLAVSRNTGTPLDTTMGEAAGRRVAEMIEKTTIGVNTGITYGGASTQTGGYGRTSSVYGYINFTPRLTKTNLTTPLGTNPEATLSDVLTMRDSLFLNKFYGPFMLYHSNDWDKFMDNDYARAVVGATSVATSKTLRQRLRDVEGITDVRRLDFLFASQLSSASGPGTDVDATLKAFRLIMVQMTPDVARAVNGMDITTVQWESVGGMRLNFKVMCIQVPQLRADNYGNCGILDAATS
jgi:hypothetical protein